MKILSVENIRALDEHTIHYEPVSSLDLMERASIAFCNWFSGIFPPEDRPVVVFCGPGNNGGDGLAIARILHRKFYPVRIYTCETGSGKSKDFLQNWERLPAFGALYPIPIHPGGTFPELPADAIIVDAIFGSGLKRPPEGYWAELIDYLNDCGCTIAAVDIPSGLFADRHSIGTAINADYTFSFELPKLAFLLPENHAATGAWFVESIGLDKKFMASLPCDNHYLDHNSMAQILKPRPRYSHKGSFGHALLWVGGHGKAGAAVLVVEAALRAGAGLVTVHAPGCAYTPLQTAVPEAMVSSDTRDRILSEVPELSPYKAIGAGCGAGTAKDTAAALENLLVKAKIPLVLDADALNIIAANPGLKQKIPQESILTPHPGEFVRLFGKSNNDFERLELLRTQAKALQVIILLKGAHTCIAAPDGQCYFNSTGNPGMATAGSGDVLTGIITGLLAQGYTPLESALLGAYLHGLAGDEAAKTIGMQALIASDIINHLGKAFLTLCEK